jgi:uncharacterized protein YtpQ (UPF0354 family)
MPLKDQLERKSLKREDLFALYAEEIRARFAPRKVAFDGPDALQIESATGRQITVYLENLWIQCRNSMGERSDVFERHLAALASAMEPDDGPPAGKDNLIAIVKDHEYLALSHGNRDPVVREHLAGDLWIVYALDLPSATQALAESTMKKLNIAPEELRSLAIGNLRRILPDIERHGGGPWYMLTAGGDYTASLLLLEDVWEQLKESVEGDIVVAVPSRDVVLFTGSRSKEGIETIKRKAQNIHQTGDHVVSQTLFRLSSGKWSVF